MSSEASSSHSCVLCLGHNKGWEQAASTFAVRSRAVGGGRSMLQRRLSLGSTPQPQWEAAAPNPDPDPTHLTVLWRWLLQGQAVKLGNSHAALLEAGGGSWEEAFAAEAGWSLASVVVPDGAA